MNLIRTHAGFYITKSIRIGQTEFVIGRRQRKPTEYVSWHVLGPDNYQNGRYFTESEPSTNIISAYQSLFQRALDHYKTELANKGVAPFTCEDIGVLERLVNTLTEQLDHHLCSDLRNGGWKNCSEQSVEELIEPYLNELNYFSNIIITTYTFDVGGETNEHCAER